MKMCSATDLPWAATRLARFIERNGYASLEDLQIRSLRDSGAFWAQAMAELGVSWAQPYESLLVLGSEPGSWRWFAGGRLSLLENLVARHARQAPERPALQWEGVQGEPRRRTYGQLLEEVEILAAGLAELGLGRGDRLAAYLPMLPETVALWLAAGAIGAVILPLDPELDEVALKHALQASGAKLVACADGYLCGGRVERTVETARVAAAACPAVVSLVVVAHRGGEAPASPPGAVPEVPYRALLQATAAPLPAAAWDASQPLFLMPGEDAGGGRRTVLHSHGGLPVKAALDLALAFDLRAGDRLLWAVEGAWDLWPWLVCGGLLLGATLVLAEGWPGEHPGPRLWELVQRHRITHLGLAPGVVAALMAGHHRPADGRMLDSVRVFGSSGERWSEAQWLWLFQKAGQCRRPIVNFVGGIETGGAVLTGFPGLPLKPCAFAGPMVGVGVERAPRPPGASADETGDLVVTRVWPGLPTSALGADGQASRGWLHTLGDHPRAWMDADGYWFCLYP